MITRLTFSSQSAILNHPLSFLKYIEISGWGSFSFDFLLLYIICYIGCWVVPQEQGPLQMLGIGKQLTLKIRRRFSAYQDSKLNIFYFNSQLRKGWWGEGRGHWNANHVRFALSFLTLNTVSIQEANMRTRLRLQLDGENWSQDRELQGLMSSRYDLYIRGMKFDHE